MSSVAHLVADQVISKSVGEVSLAVEKFSHAGDHHELTERPRSNTEEQENILKNRAKLKKKHRRMEVKREKMRRNIRAKYGLKQPERHRSGPHRGNYEADEKQQLFTNESDDDECCCCCFGQFYKKGQSTTKAKQNFD